MVGELISLPARLGLRATRLWLQAAHGAAAVAASAASRVSQQPELVETLAEPGAEAGAGAEVRVDEPWDGYRRMNAKEIIGRLAAGATPAELAAVQLYESRHRGRRTIVAAAARELRSINGSDQPRRGQDA